MIGLWREKEMSGGGNYGEAKHHRKASGKFSETGQLRILGVD